LSSNLIEEVEHVDAGLGGKVNEGEGVMKGEIEGTWRGQKSRAWWVA